MSRSMQIRRVGSRLFALLLAAVAAGCSVQPAPRNAAIEVPPRAISAERIQRMGAATAWEALQQEAPRMEIRSGAQPTLHLQGRAGTRELAVIVNGRTVDPIVLYTLPASWVTRIEVVTGSAAVRHGVAGRYAGVLLVSTL
jgi:hypothetical protein